MAPWNDPLADPGPLIRRVYAYVAYRIGDGPEAEDITAEAFARAIRYRDSFDRRRSQPITWLTAIARNVIADTHRREADVLTPGAPDGGVTTDHAPSAAERLDLRDAMSALSDRDRELLSLRYGADLTARQIGDMLDMDVHAVEVAVGRALQRLRDRLLVEA